MSRKRAPERRSRQSKTSSLVVRLNQQAPALSEDLFECHRSFYMESQEVMMDNFVNYSHVNPLKEPNQPCECQCVAYRLKGLKWFRENVEVIFAGLLEDGRVNHYHQGSVSHAEGSHLYEFGEQRMSIFIWRILTCIYLFNILQKILMEVKDALQSRFHIQQRSRFHYH
jgi:hypothetical protein